VDEGAAPVTPESSARIALALRMVGRAKSLVQAVGAMVALRRVLHAENVDIDEIAAIVENWGALEEAIDSEVQDHATEVADAVELPAAARRP